MLQTFHTNTHLLHLSFAPVLRSSVSQTQEDSGSCLLPDRITILVLSFCADIEDAVAPMKEMAVHGVSTSGQI